MNEVRAMLYVAVYFSAILFIDCISQIYNRFMALSRLQPREPWCVVLHRSLLFFLTNNADLQYTLRVHC